jgi:hypothetical protein
VYGLHLAQIDEERGFLGLALKPRSTVSRFEPQNRQLRFGDLGLKIAVSIPWFGHQTQAGDGLSVAPQNRWEEDDVGHESRSSGLLHLEASQTRVFQFASKLAEERRRVVHVALSWRSHEDKVEGGCVDATDYIRLFYPNFDIFIILAPKSILVFWLGI